MVPLFLPPPVQTPAPAPKPAEALVQVEARSLALPPLPAEPRPGQAQWKAIRAQIAATQEDLARSLQTLYAIPAARHPLPADLSVPAEAAEEGSALIAVVDDRAFARLEQTYLEIWRGWQAVLVEEGLGSRAQSAPLPAHASQAYERVRQKVRSALQVPSREIQTVSRLDAGYHKQDAGDAFTPEQLGATPLRREELALETAHDKDVVLAQKRQVAARLLLPDLIEAWNPLVARLEEGARQVMAQERPATPSVDADLAALRLHARLAVLERFRKALWYCDLVWCQMASIEPPPPPPRLIGRAPSKP
jgi:hypothetical protein